MAEVYYNAFLSSSFAEEDKQIADFFKRMISAFDIKPTVYDYQEIGKLTQKVKENIIKSDCFIAVITKRHKIEGTDKWACPGWIHHELAMANAYNKPIAIFIEEGVAIEGLIEVEERRERFDRADLLKNIDKIATFLFKLREYMDTSSRVEMIQTPLLLRHYIHASDEMISKEKVVERTEILMESLSDGLESTYHSVEVEEMTSNLSVKPVEFDFKCLEKPSRVTVKPEIVMNTDAKFFWKVVFLPPLKKGEQVKYAFKEARANNRPYTYEELMTRIEKNTYEYTEPKCEACEWTINFPTYELYHEFTFPENYEIENFFPYVAVNAAKLKSEEEIKRIEEGNMFTAEKVFDKWILKLKVHKPLLNHTYYTYYLPAMEQRS